MYSLRTEHINFIVSIALKSRTADRARNPNYPLFWLADSQSSECREKPLTAGCLAKRYTLTWHDPATGHARLECQ